MPADMALVDTQLIDIEILSCQNPSSFLGREVAVVPISDCASHFQEEARKWNDELESKEDQTAVNHNPHVDEICATKKSSCNTWSRVKIEKIFHTSRGDQALCYFVDSGEKQQMPIYRLRKLPDEFKAVPFQVRRMKLWGVKPQNLQIEVTSAGLEAIKRSSSKWDEAAVSYFQNLVAKARRARVQVVHGDVNDVQHVLLHLNLSGQEICINDKLVVEEYAVYGSSEESVSPGSTTRSSCSSPESEHLTTFSAIQAARPASSARTSYSDTETTKCRNQRVMTSPIRCVAQKRRQSSPCSENQEICGSLGLLTIAAPYSYADVCPISPAPCTASVCSDVSLLMPQKTPDGSAPGLPLAPVLRRESSCNNWTQISKSNTMPSPASSPSSISSCALKTPTNCHPDLLSGASGPVSWTSQTANAVPSTMAGRGRGFRMLNSISMFCGSNLSLGPRQEKRSLGKCAENPVETMIGQMSKTSAEGNSDVALRHLCSSKTKMLSETGGQGQCVTQAQHVFSDCHVPSVSVVARQNDPNDNNVKDFQTISQSCTVTNCVSDTTVCLASCVGSISVTDSKRKNLTAKSQIYSPDKFATGKVVDVAECQDGVLGKSAIVPTKPMVVSLNELAAAERSCSPAGSLPSATQSSHLSNEMESSVDRKLLGKRVLDQIGKGCAEEMSALHLPQICRPDRPIPSPYLGVCVWGSMLRKPVFEVCDAHFADVISKDLAKEDFKIQAVQAYTWPSIMQGRHVVGIAKTGKILSYLPGILSLLLQSSSYCRLPAGGAPKCLVLVPCWKKAHKIMCLANKMLQGKTSVVCMAIYAGSCEENQVIPLIRGCDLLVATPKCLLRMLDQRYTNLSRLCHLVLHDADVLCEQFTSEINDIMTHYAHVLRRYSTLAVPRQILAFGTQWTAGLVDFQEKFQKDSIKVFASRLEASVYCRVKQVVHMCLNRMGLRRFTDLMNSLVAASDNRIVVATETEASLEEIKQLLQSLDVCCVVISPELTDPGDLQELKERWQVMSGSSVLVVTDEMVNELSVTCANVVVHYDLPKSKTRFGSRLAMMVDNYCDPDSANFSNTTTGIGSSKPKQQPVSHILVKETCQVERVKSLYDFLTRSGTAIPPDLEAFIKGISEGRNTAESTPLCSHIRAYGFCRRNKPMCYDRHLVLSADKGDDSWLPEAGEVKVRVGHVNDISHYFVRLLEHRGEDGAMQKYSGTYGKLVVDLAQVFLNPENVSPYSLTEDARELAVVKTKEQTYHRAKVLHVFETKKFIGLKMVEVFYVDEGITVRVTVDQLLKLPREWQSIPPQAVEVYICRVKPMDGDTEWSQRSSRFIEDNLLGKEFVGRIVLKMKNTLWLDPLAQQERLETLKTQRITMIVRNELINRRLADDNPEHIKNLYKLCEGKILVPKKLIQKYFSLPVECFIDRERLEICEEFIKVCISVVDSPGHFFLQKWDNLEELDTMVEKLNKHMEKARQPRSLCDETCTSDLATPELATVSIAKPDILTPSQASPDISQVSCAEKVSPAPLPSSGVVAQESQSIGGNHRGGREHSRDLDVGSVCAACFPEDRRWYRGRLQQRLDGGWQVFFIDFGEKQFVPNCNISPLPDIFCEMPAQAIECSLAYIKPVGDEWSSESIEAMNDMSLSINGEEKRLLAKVIGVEESDCAGQKKFTVDVFDTNIAPRDLRFSQELIALRLARCDHEEKLENPFSKVTFSSLKVYSKFDDKVRDMCAALYWSEREDKAGQLSEAIAKLLVTRDDLHESSLSLSVVLEAALKLIGHLWSCDAHSTLLMAVVQCVEQNPGLCLPKLGQEIALRLILCLEQVRRPKIQIQGARAAAQLVRMQNTCQDKHFWEFMDKRERITIFCDILYAEPDLQIITPVCSFFTEMLRHSEICQSVAKTRSLVSQTVVLLKQAEDTASLEMTEALLSLLDAAAACDTLHPHLLRESAVQCLVTILRKAPSQLSLFYSASVCQQLCQASRKNKRILLEAELVPIIKNLLSRGLQSPGLEMCQELELSLAIQFPQQEVLAGRVVSLTESPGANSVKVMWSQSSFRIHLTVLLRGAKAEDFTFQEDRVYCRHMQNDQVCSFDYTLFDKVQPEKCQIKVQANDVKLTLTKQQKGKWSRLLREKQKHPLVHVDFDNLMDSSESEEGDTHTGQPNKKLRLPRLEQNEDVHYFSLSDHSSESQDELLSDSGDERFETIE